MENITDGDGQRLYNGDRVWTFDFDGSRIYGTLNHNEDDPSLAEWWVEYDDGMECAVIEPSLIFKA